MQDQQRKQRMNAYTLLHAILVYLKDIAGREGEDRVLRGGVPIYQITTSLGGPKLSYEAVRRAVETASEDRIKWLSWVTVGLDSHGKEKKNIVLTQEGLDFIKSPIFEKLRLLLKSGMGYELKPRRRGW